MGFVYFHLANYMDNWKCTGILKGNGSPVNASSTQQGVFNAPVGTATSTLQNSVNGTSVGRYGFFYESFTLLVLNSLNI